MTVQKRLSRFAILIILSILTTINCASRVKMRTKYQQIAEIDEFSTDDGKEHTARNSSMKTKKIDSVYVCHPSLF